MNRIYNRIIFVLFILMIWAQPSCTDDRLWNDEKIGEGNAKISAAVTFKNFTPALDSRGSDGNALNSINNLYLFAYTEDGETLVSSHLFDKDQLNIPQQPTNVEKPDGATPEVEIPTYAASFNFILPYGKYKLYAVANIPEQYITQFQGANVKNEVSLKQMDIPWDANDITNNGIMFGWFGTEDLISMNITNKDAFNAPVVTVNKSGVSLNAWLRRLASKVTVSFDPSGLNEKVTIYVKSVTIRHIPKRCYIGETNTPKSSDQLITDVDADPIQVINYFTEGNENDHTDWLTLQKGTPVDLDKPHDHNGESLFFFENCQGDFEGKGSQFSKQMDKTEMAENEYIPTGGNPDGATDYVDYKDKVPYGSFIEVEAYYSSLNEENFTSGPIRYRFMLGKNVTYNYDAERNYHYKITLKFKGWANEPDWHIDYEEPEHGIHTPEEYFISYLYNQTMSMPVRLTNPEGIRYLRAEIIENNWAPYDPTQPDELPATPTYTPYNSEEFSWYKAAYTLFNKSDEYNDWDAYRGRGNFLGFLSLRQTTDTKIGGNEKYSAAAIQTLIDYYVSHKEWWAEYDLTKSGEINIENDSKYGNYTVTKDESDGSITVNVPMWTRAKSMVEATDFTGNNPYNAFRRKAKVRFMAYNENRELVQFQDQFGTYYPYKEVPIYQVERVVNPKAVWRSAANDAEFQIDMSILKVANTDIFSPVTSSIGPWRASIMVSTDISGDATVAGGDAWFTLSDNDETVTKVFDGDTSNGENYIDGSTGSAISFKYKPNGTISADKARYGIIKVEYNNYTCVHLIMVRQGYDAKTKIGSKNWSCYNVYAMNGQNTGITPQKRDEAENMRVIITESPLSIGSMFKRGNYEDGILEANNRIYGPYYPINYGDIELQVIKLNDDGTTTVSSKKWNAMPGWGQRNYNGKLDRKGEDYSWAKTFVATNRNNDEFTIPSWSDYNELTNNKNVEFGFGVVYADGATGCASDIKQAYTYYDTNNEGKWSNENQGMRGVIIYDSNNGKQIFLPLGVEGQGKRSRKIDAIDQSLPFLPNSTTLHASSTQMKGTLSYSGIFGVLKNYPINMDNIYRPITYNLYRNPGAVYWFDIPRENGHYNGWSFSWDINYFTLNFSPYDSATLGMGGNVDDKYAAPMADVSDALPIRLIYKDKTPIN